MDKRIDRLIKGLSSIELTPEQLNREKDIRARAQRIRIRADQFKAKLLQLHAEVLLKGERDAEAVDVRTTIMAPIAPYHEWASRQCQLILDSEDGMGGAEAYFALAAAMIELNLEHQSVEREQRQRHQWWSPIKPE
jgi:hypothetical protein